MKRKPAPPFLPHITGPSMMAITCRCGHMADFDEFRSTPVGGELPDGTYQCPCCKHAWRMEKQGEDRFYESGLHIPADRIAVTIPTFL